MAKYLVVAFLVCLLGGLSSGLVASLVDWYPLMHAAVGLGAAAVGLAVSGGIMFLVWMIVPR